MGLIKTIDKKRSFRSYKTDISDNLTDYGSNNVGEAFAEIFAYSTMDLNDNTKYLQVFFELPSKNRKKKIIAREVIREMNEETKAKLMSQMHHSEEI